MSPDVPPLLSHAVEVCLTFASSSLSLLSDGFLAGISKGSRRKIGRPFAASIRNSQGATPFFGFCCYCNCCFRRIRVAKAFPIQKLSLKFSNESIKFTQRRNRSENESFY